MSRLAWGSVAALAVLLVGGAVPALSSSSAPGRRVVPLRLQDPAAYSREKASAERRYEAWRQRRGLAPVASAPGRDTVVSGNLNQPGLTDAATTGTPSDSTGAVGPSNYVEFINSEIGIYSNTDLTTPPSTLGESAFVGDPSAFTCDPQVQWDQEGQRWLYAALNCGAATGSEVLYFGFSKTASPGPLSSNWCRYSVATGNSIEDYPKLGHDDTQIIIGTNAFDDRGNEPYLESHILVFDKPSPGDIATCPTSGTELGTMLEATANSGIDFTPVPANVADSSSVGYVVAETDLSHLDLYAIGRDGGGSNVVLSRTPVTVPAFDLPANVPQPGTSDELDSSDTRLTQAVAVTDPATGQEGIWTQHTVAGSGGGPSVVRWYELTPGASTPRQTGTVGGPTAGSFAFNGAISPTSDGTGAAIFYNSGSSSQPADLRVQDRRSDTTLGLTFEDLQLAASAHVDGDFSCPSQGGGPSCRWGDYAGASPDPGNACLVWGTSMLTVDQVDLIGGTPQWGTQNAAVNVCAYAVSVTKSGAGSGTVTSEVAGISCGSTCTHAYDSGTSVTLTATPATGSSFAGWSGACSGTGTCTVSMTQARSVTATFSLVPETLTVSDVGAGSGTVGSAPAGISCGSTCSHAYPYGTGVTLTATPASGSRFAGWSGACSGAGACTVTMNQAEAVSATFALKPVCVVPKLKGKTLKAAKRALSAAHCRAGKITRKASKVQKGHVISQKPKPGKHLPAGTRVSLVVSEGKRA